MSSFIIYLLEPDNFGSVGVGMWWVLTTVTTVGYGDYAPITLEGRLLAIFLYIVGIGLIGVVIGKVVDSFGTYAKLKEEGNLIYKGTNHFVIIGWSIKAEQTVQELLLSNEQADIVLIDHISKTPFEHHRFHYVQGDATSAETFKRANMSESNAVLIFSPQEVEDVRLADGHTLIVATAVQCFAEETNPKKDIYTIVEIAKDTHVPHFKHAHIDEFVLSHNSTSYLMAKSSIHKGSSHLFRQLLSKRYGDDVYELKKRKDWRTYQDAFQSLNQEGANLIADGQDFSIIRRLNDVIPDDARLFVICDDETYAQIIAARNT